MRHVTVDSVVVDVLVHAEVFILVFLEVDMVTRSVIPRVLVILIVDVGTTVGGMLICIEVPICVGISIIICFLFSVLRTAYLIFSF